jgi:cytochrome b pre-mRNA-processing protein 3
MFALLKKKNIHQEAAKAVYAQLLDRTRAQVFYKGYGVPDTFNGRFDVLVLHVFLIVNRMKDEGAAGRDFNQALFDATFADMDQTLREMGIGDMGVPKHMRRMMKGFNGRVHAYTEALEDETMEYAIRRNIYAGREIPQEQFEKLEDYIRISINALKARSASDIFEGRKIF